MHGASHARVIESLLSFVDELVSSEIHVKNKALRLTRVSSMSESVL